MADKSRRAKVPLHLRLFHSIMDSVAYHHLSGNALKVLLALVRIDNGTRNGEIAFSYRRAAEVTGLSPRTCLRCLGELQNKGFIVCTLKGAFSRKVLHASLWRYTWEAWPGKMGPTRDFEKWTPDGNTRVQVLSSPGAVSNTKLETPTAPDAEFAPDGMETWLVSTNRQNAKLAPLTSYQGEPSAAAETEQRKQSNPVERQNLDALRNALIEHLRHAEPGEQSRLADALPIPGGTLSKFINGRNLPDQYRARLTDVVLSQPRRIAANG